MPIPIRPIIPRAPFPRVPLPRPNPPTQTTPIPPDLRNPPNQRTPFPGAPRGRRPEDNGDFCVEGSGAWCVKAIVPTITPEKIRYRYPDEDWQELEAKDYFIVQPPSVPAEWGDTGEFYDCFIEDTNKAFVECIFQAMPYRYRLLVNNGYAPFKVFSEDYGTDFTVLDANTCQRVAVAEVPVKRYTVRCQETPNGSNYSRILADIRAEASLPVNNILRIQKLIKSSNGEQWQSPASRCIFRVFDGNNQEVFSRTESVCPQVEVIPEKCEFKPQNKQIVAKHRKIALLLNQYLKVDTEDNCIVVRVITEGVNDSFPSNLIFRREIARVCSPEGCPPPQYEVECPCKPCDGKKCPPGTKTRILIGNRLQCVDANGCIISEIPFDKDCETYDCTC